MINSAVSGLTRERMIFMFISISMEQTNTNTTDRAKAGEPDVSWTPCRLRMTVKKKRKRMDHIHINCFCHCHWCSRLVRCTFFSIFVLCDNRSKTERRSSLKKSESSSSCCNNENPSQPVCKVAHLHSQNGKSFTAGSSAGPTPERAAAPDWSRNPVSVQWLGDWTVVLGRWGQSAGGSNANQRWWSQMELNIDFFYFFYFF